MWYENEDGCLINLRNVNCIYQGTSGNIVANFGEQQGFQDIVILEYCKNKADADAKLQKLSRMMTCVKIGE
jgi:hypothetical protein